MKRFIKICAIGMCIGIALAAIQIYFHMDESVFMYGYGIAAVAIVVGTILINILYSGYYLRKVRSLSEQFLKEDPQKYIDGIQGLLKTVRGQTLKNILLLNLTVGYIEKKNYDKAIRVLEELASKRLNGAALKVVYCINLFSCYYETKQYEKAITLYHENQKLIEKFRHHKTYGGNIAILDMLAAMIHENYHEAEEILESAKKTYDAPQFQKVFQEISDMLDEIKEKSIK